MAQNFVKLLQHPISRENNQRQPCIIVQNYFSLASGTVPKDAFKLRLIFIMRSFQKPRKTFFPTAKIFVCLFDTSTIHYDYSFDSGPMSLTCHFQAIFFNPQVSF